MCRGLGLQSLTLVVNGVMPMVNELSVGDSTLLLVGGTERSLAHWEHAVGRKVVLATRWL